MPRSAVLALLSLVAGCPGSPRPPLGPPPPAGVSGDPLAGFLEVRVIDEVTGERLELPVAVVLADGTRLELAPGGGTLEGSHLVPPIAVEVEAVGRPQRWQNVAGSRVVFGVARPDRLPMHVTVEAPATANEVRLRMLAPPRLVRTDHFDRTDSLSCSTFACEIDLDVPETALGAAAILYVDDEPAGAAVGRTDDPSMVRIDARMALTSSVARDITLPAPPELLPEVVGVPGVVAAGRVALLGYSELGHFVVPGSGGPFWLLARAQSVLGGPESVVIQHGVTSLDAAAEWPAWLGLPTVSVGADDSLVVTPPAGATVLVVDWYGSGEYVMDSTLVLGPEGTITVPAPDVFSASRARVRALDVPGVTPGTFDLAGVDGAAIRYADVEVELGP